MGFIRVRINNTKYPHQMIQTNKGVAIQTRQ